MPAEIPFDTIVLRVFFPRWTILVPVSACCRLLVAATEKNSPTELSPIRMQQGYFQVIAAGLDPRPRDLRAAPLAQAALGDEVVNYALAVLVARDTSSGSSNT